MADETITVDEADTAEDRYDWPRPSAGADPSGEGPRLPADGPPIAYAAEPGRELGPVLPWLGRSFRTAGRILVPAMLLTAVVELVVWAPEDVFFWRNVRSDAVQTAASFGRGILVALVGALVVHLALARHLGLRAGLGRATRRARGRVLPVLLTAVVFAALSAVLSPIMLWSLHAHRDASPFIPIAFGLVHALVTVPILFASVAAVAGPAGVNPFTCSWRLASGRWWALVGRQLALLLATTVVGWLAAIAVTVAFVPLLDRFDTGPRSWPFLVYSSAHLTVSAAARVVAWAATAELYLAAGGSGEI